MSALWLPWPNWKLSTNGRRRLHWRKEAELVKAARATTFYMLARARLPKSAPDGKLALQWAVTPPDKRARDDDNLITAVKPYRDEIAKWLGVDDSVFVTQPVIWKPAKGKEFAHVTVTWRPLDA